MIRPTVFLAPLLAFTAPALAQDADGDGVPAYTDCDDSDPNNFPGNAEVCDGQDNDCNGLADFSGGGAWTSQTGSSISNPDYTKGNVFLASGNATISEYGMYLDVFANAQLTLTVGEATSSSGPYTIVSTEVLGAVPSGAQWHTATGVSIPVTAGMYYWVGATWNGSSAVNYYDSGGATSDPSWGSFVTGAWTNSATAPTTGWTPDSLPTGAYDMLISTGTGGEIDGDGDGWMACDSDCDDTDPLVHPGATELCDGVDNDCNGLPDADQFGEVDPDGDSYLSCEDCDEQDPSVNPGAVELCDGRDNDCNGLADADPGGEQDSDGDGYLSCQECDDSDPATNPVGIEICDGKDNDCDGEADFNGPGGEVDGDGDGWAVCEECDDSNPAANPDAIEACDGVDNDCDGSVDEDLQCGGSVDETPEVADKLGGCGCSSSGVPAVLGWVLVPLVMARRRASLPR